MRACLIFTSLVILLSPACSATQPIKPAVTVTLSPSSVNVTSQWSQKISLTFDGTVTVDKLPLERIVVNLNPHVDVGWPCNASPTTMVITDESPHSFSCTVVVPEGMPNTTGTLTVDAVANGGGFSVTSTATAIIVVTGPPGYNQTSQNHSSQNPNSQNQTSTNGTQVSTARPGALDSMSVPIIAVVLVAAASGGGGYFFLRRKMRQRQGSG